MKEKSRYEKGLDIAVEIWGKEFVEEALANLKKLHPDFERYVVEYVLGDIYGRPKLDTKIRIFCTITTLAALGRENQLRMHILGALKKGITKDEILEVLIHLSVYAGFPVAWNSLIVARQVFAEQKI